MEIKKAYITIQEASQYVGIPVPTLYRKVSDKELVAYKPAKRLMFKIEDLDRWMKKNPAA